MNNNSQLYDSDYSDFGYQSLEAPPPYSRHEQPKRSEKCVTEHTYRLTQKKSEWLTLKLMSVASSSNQLPRIVEGQAISGSLAINIPNTGGDGIQAITLCFCGHLLTGSGSQERVKFFQHIHPIWSKGDPLPEDQLPAKKLQENHDWAFSFQLPSTFTLPEKYAGRTNGELEALRLPQTFFESKTNASIRYSLVVDVTRSALRRDSRLETCVYFMPNIQPAPPSLLRQQAYKTMSQFLPDERSDKDGWITLPSTSICGRMPDGRYASTACVLSLANPLSYTRGVAIPCTLDVQSSDTNALDVLANADSIVVCLQRRISYIPCSTIVSAAKTLDLQACAQSKVETIEFATWWLRKQSDHHRHFHGEIYLDDELEPSMSQFAYMSVEYSVAMFPFDPVGFTPNKPALEPIVSQTVEIANVYAAGPRAVRYSTSKSHRSTTAAVEKDDSGDDMSSLEMLTRYYDGSGSLPPPAVCAW